MSDQAIADHAFLSDCHSSALVTRDGSVDWLTFPRFDSPSVMARVLDRRAGHFRVGPAEPVLETSRRYVDGSLVLETTFETEHGLLRLTDAMAVGVGERGHDLGRDAPHVLLRHVVCDRGTVDLDIEFHPRPEYGRTHPQLFLTDTGVTTRGGPDRLTLASDVDLSIDDGVALGQRTLPAGETASFAVQWSRAWGNTPAPWKPSDVADRLQDTREAWSSWSAQHQGHEGRWRQLVRFSGAVLQGLTFQPTGAIVAAPTTSLPETVGGSRNWDYRYAWLRDASMTLDALWVAACPDEARHFVEWLVGAAAADMQHGAPIQIMYGIGGEHDLAERTLDHLNGWRGSRPVRIGNGAFDQRQLDVYGAVLDAIARLRDQLVPFDPSTRGFLVDLAEAAAREWDERDQGIWEVRGGPRHFLYSKLMCWVALDRALQLADDLEVPPPTRDRWRSQREAIREAILERGYDEDLGTFTQALDEPVLDASALRISLVGLLPGDDPRIRSTIDAIERDLTDDRGFVYRYRSDDGLEDEEGSFLLCTFWLAHAHALAGNLERAREVFDLAVSVRNDVDLLAEEYGDGEMLGNFPQAFSHVGLVTAAWAIDQTERGHDRDHAPTDDREAAGDVSDDRS
jgi:GH15 family glucan-1,4-alpha-glucosidase